MKVMMRLRVSKMSLTQGLTMPSRYRCRYLVSCQHSRVIQGLWQSITAQAACTQGSADVL